MTDLKPVDLAAYQAAVGTLSPEDMNADGTPGMTPLNKALADEGYGGITAKERDAFIEAAATQPEPVAHPVTDLPDPEPDLIAVVITRASASPVPLYIHGVGQFSLALNQTHHLPAEAVEALRNASGITLEIKES